MIKLIWKNGAGATKPGLTPLPLPTCRRDSNGNSLWPLFWAFSDPLGLRGSERDRQQDRSGLIGFIATDSIDRGLDWPLGQVRICRTCVGIQTVIYSGPFFHTAPFFSLFGGTLFVPDEILSIINKSHNRNQRKNNYSHRIQRVCNGSSGEIVRHHEYNN